MRLLRQLSTLLQLRINFSGGGMQITDIVIDS